MLEDLPESENRITLDPKLKDTDGIPAPRVEYRLGSNSRNMLPFAIARARDLFEAAGAAEIFVDSLVQDSGWQGPRSQIAFA